MELTNELFVIPAEKDFILYAPLKGTAVSVNSGMIQLLKEFQATRKVDDRLSPLVEKGLIVEKQEAITYPKIGEFKPTSVTIMPSTDCNLRCVYCYGNGGLNPSYIKEEYALAGIDLIVKNAVEQKAKKIGVTFHGGGEPLYLKTFDIVKNSVEYAKQEAKRFELNFSISAGTNGILNDSQRKWIVKNLERITLSFDGLPEFQDSQRPTASGGGSYNYLKKSLDFFDENNCKYTLRATITKDSVGKMVEMVDFVKKNTSAKAIHLEPLYKCGRCLTSKIKTPRVRDFSNNLIKSTIEGERIGMRVLFSSAMLNKINNKFCGAAGDSFCITQDGFVTSCYEVIRQEDPRSKVFFYGKYNPRSHSFDFDLSKRDYLSSRTIEKLENCTDCFVKYNCGGECLAQSFEDGNIFNLDKLKGRCKINQEYLKYQIEKKIKDGK